jgi:hypothetical protein
MISEYEYKILENESHKETKINFGKGRVVHLIKLLMLQFQLKYLGTQELFLKKIVRFLN